MEQRNTRKGSSDNYQEARSAIQARAKNPNAATFMWLEVAEGKQPEAIDYVIHASAEASSVPPFAIEVYKDGVIQSYEVRADAIRENALMPEELRQRIVQAQKAGGLIDKMLTSERSATAATAP